MVERMPKHRDSQVVNYTSTELLVRRQRPVVELLLGIGFF